MGANLQGIWQVRNTAAYGLEDHVARHGCPRAAVSLRAAPFRISPLRQPRDSKTRHTKRRPIRSKIATCLACRGSCTCRFRSTFIRPEHIALRSNGLKASHDLYERRRAAGGIDFWMGDSRGAGRVTRWSLT